MKYSFIIPVYNRPDEVDELLDSLTRQTVAGFEVLVVEDGSARTCRDIVEKYAGRLNVRYFYKDNSGPGQTRNYGARLAQGEYLIILDSDCVLPAGYLKAVDDELASAPADAFGGPDRAHPDFTDMQKAINYAMTSFFTTGGIRGGKKKLDKFYPRSFNMGIRCEVYEKLGGFSSMRFGEDIDLSLRIFEGGYRCRLFPEAWVWHKRRTDLKKFFKQVHNSGIARINLMKRHPGSLKLVHTLPSVFTVGVTLCVLAAIVGIALAASGCAAWLTPFALCPLVLYALLIFIDASRKEHSLKVGLRSIAAAYVQLIGYGSGFLRAFFERCVLGRGEFEAFKKNFYK
jgi:glycosyltransferase involved in cell wall biosynthesis